MRVAIFLPNLGGGGAERVALVCANDLVTHGHEVDLVLACEGGELIPLLSPKVNVVELKAARMLASLPALVRYLRKRRPSALHAHMWPVTIIAIMAHRLAGSKARLIVTDHVAYSASFLTPWQMRMLRWTTRFLYPLADHRLVVSKGAAEDLVRISGLDHQSFEVVYNPVNLPPSCSAGDSVEELWPAAAKRFINIGALKKQKNQALLIRAFARLPDNDTALLILGEGSEREALAALAVELGVAERVEMPGFVLDPWPYLASADVFVLSSDYEGFGIVLAEALYAGLNIVSTDCKSGPAEILDGGQFGMLVPCNDVSDLASAMMRALERPREPERMRKRASELTGKLSLARHRELMGL